MSATQPETPARHRYTWLRVDEVRLVDHWCRNLRQMFPESAFIGLVGSVIERPDYRDVDVRIVLPDEQVDALPMDRLDLNMLLSRWGQEQTGLPIDCQVQSFTENAEHHDRPRHPRGLK